MRTQRGFTLLEIVIATALMIMITAVVLNGFGPWIRFKQRLETEQILKDLVQSTTALYKANAYNIDDNDPSTSGTPLGAANGALLLTATSSLQTECTLATTGADPADTTAVMATLAPLQPYLSKALATVAKDGFNNAMCVLVSPRQEKMYGGVKLYYHTLAFISAGDNNTIDPNTAFVDNGSGWTLTLDGDDTGATMDGFQIAVNNYKVTQDRLQRLAKAYETYFNIRFLTKADRDISIDYFYSNSGTNNGDPAGSPGDPGPTIGASKATLGATWAQSSFDNVIALLAGNKVSSALGVSDSDGRDAWGNPILFDNRSARVKAGVDAATVKQQPPFSATFGSLLPGSGTACVASGSPNSSGNICEVYLSATAVGTY